MGWKKILSQKRPAAGGEASFLIQKELVYIGKV